MSEYQGSQTELEKFSGFHLTPDAERVLRDSPAVGNLIDREQTVPNFQEPCEKCKRPLLERRRLACQQAEGEADRAYRQHGIDGAILVSLCQELQDLRQIGANRTNAALLFAAKAERLVWNLWSLEPPKAEVGDC